MPPIQFGFHIPAELRDKQWQATYLADLDRSLDLISGHFDSAWVVDHLQFGDMGVLEGFTTLAYMAARHPALKFGHAVICQSFRNPALLAKMASTLQFLSGGRYILGIGTGWHEEEYAAYGYDFPSGAVRVAQLEEALQIIRAMWTQEKATFEGKYYRVVEAYCEPKPDPQPPVVVGAFGPKMLRVAAKYGDRWDVSSTPIERYRRMLAEFERACVQVGRDPATVRRSWSGGCFCAPTWEEAKAQAQGIYGGETEDEFDFLGTPAQVIEQMRRFVDAGVDYFMLSSGSFPGTTTLEMLINEVLPALNG